MFSGKAKLAGVIGCPVVHSLSPRLHNYWLNHYNIDGVYLPLAVAPENLAEVLRILPKMGFSGVNLTLPHKEAVLPLLDSVDEQAQQIGAVNTIVIENGQLHGSNTDSYGFSENIRPHLNAHGKAVILGAGGAAKSIIKSLINNNFNGIFITNRTLERAEALSKQFAGRLQVVPWEARDEALEQADLLVNTTSLGLRGHEALEINLDTLPQQAVVTDIVYAPLITPLLAQAQARGNKVVDGLGMLLHQAVPGFEAWFGVRPEVTQALRDAVLHG